MAQLWFKFWAKEYLADTKVRCLSYEQRGILQTLWAFAWEEGSIPGDPAMLGNMLGLPAKAMRTHCEWIPRFFVANPSDPTRMISPRLELDRAEADAKGSKARESALQRWNKRDANAYANASNSDEQTQCVDPCVSHAGQGQGQKELITTPLPPKGGTEQKPKRSRRSQEEILSPFPAEVRLVLKGLWSKWRKEDGPDHRVIHLSPEDTASNVRLILAAHPEISPEILVLAGLDYCASERTRYKAPQYFFGPEGPWKAFVQSVLTKEEVAHAS